MYDWNLNLLITFFWLSLSSIILLSGIWLLIDCKINLKTLNFILKHLNLRGKLTNEGFIPKSYFTYIYVIGLVINFILFLNHLSYFFLYFIFIVHLFRRSYECLYIHKFHANSKVNFLRYFFGLVHYPCVGLTIIIDYKYSYTHMTCLKYLFGLSLFFYASYIQYNVHLTLANTSRNKNHAYGIPDGYWIFNYLSCPNYVAEILIYISLLIASHRTSAMASLFIWVFINQSVLALLNHRWYNEHYKEQYPTNRYALVPFVF